MKRTLVTTELALELLEFCANLSVEEDPFFQQWRVRDKNRKDMLNELIRTLKNQNTNISSCSDRQLRVLITKFLKEIPYIYRYTKDKNSFDCFHTIGIVVMPTETEIEKRFGTDHNNYKFIYDDFNRRAMPMVVSILNRREVIHHHKERHSGEHNVKLSHKVVLTCVELTIYNYCNYNYSHNYKCS